MQKILVRAAAALRIVVPSAALWRPGRCVEDDDEQ
jgi:hypothetical protein